MKKVLLALVAVAMLAGCTQRTEHGACIGVTEDKDPALTYKVSAWNVFLGIIFVETIIVPLVVVFDNIQCPSGKKMSAPKE